MANRRMFSLRVVDTDAFLEMPVSSQNLYFHLGMRADDDGFVASPKKILKFLGSGNDDLNVLISRGYVIPFDSGVIVITDWKENNYLRSDRYRPTIFQEELKQLTENNGKYALKNALAPVGIPDGNQLVYNRDPQVRLGKDSIGYINTYCAFEQDDEEKKAHIFQSDEQENEAESANEEQQHTDSKSNDNSAADKLFNELWNLFPNKKGKGRVSEKAKKRLLEIGRDEMIRAIDRYKAELKRDCWRQPQYGSTFFNSDYVDYLDANYTPGETPKAKNDFLNHEQSTTDYAELEKLLE